MKTIKHFLAILLCISLCAPLTQAQLASDKQDAQTTNTIAQDVLIIIQQEQVRFTSQKAVAEMQLQIFDQAGQVVYDSGAVTGPELTWVLRQADGEAVKSGLYAYTLSVKEAGAETARVRRGHFIVDRAKERDGQTDRLWITSQNESGVGTELTVARNEGETIAGTSVTSERKGVGAEHEAKRDGEAESKSESKVAAAAAASGTTGRIAKFTSSNDLGNSVMTELNSKIGLGTTNPISKFHIVSGANDHLPPRLESSGNTTFAAGLDFYHGTTGKGYVGVPGTATGIASGEMLVYGSPGTKTSLWAGGVSIATLDINGNFGIGTASPQQKLHVDGNEILSTGNHAGFKFRNRGSNNGADDWVWYSDGNIARFWRAGVGDLMTVDTAGLVGVNALQIRGGADFAENFDVNVAPAGGEEPAPKVEAGMVVSIDPEHPGKLQLSSQAYDSQVAGIISGAGGVKPGMIMSQEGTLADGKFPVALSGRVYCWVDAAYGAVKPGDLLTTAPTPGHAMKAIDREKAQGAIIGKAMTGLKEGKGLVLVLVTLQ
ncbi:MAG: hypothetical protein ACREBD_28920 [Blastocatellia bacterium]